MEYFAFQWHITDECDQRCKHCYIFSEDTCKHLDSMTWEQMKDTFFNCLDFCKVYHRLPYFYITGGDPILHPDFWKLLELMKENGISIMSTSFPVELNFLINDAAVFLCVFPADSSHILMFSVASVCQAEFPADVCLRFHRTDHLS